MRLATATAVALSLESDECVAAESYREFRRAYATGLRLRRDRNAGRIQREARDARAAIRVPH